MSSEIIYPALTVVPLDVVKAEFDRLHRRIDELEKILKSARLVDEPVDEFLTRKQIAAEFPLSISSLHRLDNGGELKPLRRIGKKTKIYLRKDVEAYLKGEK